MKYFLTILLIYIGTLGKAQYAQAEYDFSLDTTIYQIDCLPDIYEAVHDAFFNVGFGGLIKYTSEKVDFVNAMDTSKIHGECMDDTAAIRKLNTLLTSFTYCCFNVIHKPLKHKVNEDLIYARVVVFKDRPNYGMNVYFLVRDKKYISLIIVE